MRRRRRFIRPRRALTLIELAVVVLILGILIGILATNIGESQKKLTQKTMKLKLKTDKAKISTYLEEYKTAFGTYPSEDLGLKVLVEKVPGAPENWYRIATSEEDILDPWKRVYRYRLDENGEPVVFTLGADNQEGGAGENADVILIGAPSS